MQPATSHWPRWIRAQDLFWILLFVVLYLFSKQRDIYVLAPLVALGLFQVLEPRMRVFASDRGTVAAIAVKLVLGYVLIAYTGGINSSFYWILMLPVVSAATQLGTLGSAAFAVLSCLAYVSFAHPYFLGADNVIGDEDWPEIGLRLIFLVVVGYLTHQNRLEARRYQKAAEQLALANDGLRAAEAAVRRSERLAALGQMSAGLAHELRNPLSTMRASAEMLLKNVPPGNPLLHEMAGYVAGEVDRLNSLITRFLDFARPLQMRPRMTDIAGTADRAIAQVEQHQPPLDISIYRNYSPDIRPFLHDGELMERVLYNLLLNAAQASPTGGTVTVKTRESGELVEVSVIDRGQGIDAGNREAIFNPFFTTKSSGVGLGLSIVSRIVSEHGGTISVDSEPGEGSVFRVILPARRQKDEPAEVSSSSGSLA